MRINSKIISMAKHSDWFGSVIRQMLRNRNLPLCTTATAPLNAIWLLICAATMVTSEWINRVSHVASAVVAVDYQGSVFIGGRCLSTCNFFDVGGGINQVVSSLSVIEGGVFIAKYATNGSLIWLLKVDGIGPEWMSTPITTNSCGDVIAILSYTSNPVTIFDIGNSPVTSFGKVSEYSGLLLSFASNGSYNWGVRLTASSPYINSVDRFRFVTSGPEDEIVVAGMFSAVYALIYDSSRQVSANISTSSLSDLFAAKFTRMGRLSWLTQFGAWDSATEAMTAVDPFGDVLFMAESYNSITVRDQAGNTAIVSAGLGWYVYLVKLSGVNGSFIWSHRIISGASQEKVSAVKADRLGNVITCGYFVSATATVEDVVATNIQTLANTGAGAGYLIKYGRNGRLIWAIGIDGLNEDRCNGLTLDSSDNIYVIGQTLSCPVPFTNAQNPLIKMMECQGTATYIAKYDPDGKLLWAAGVDGQIDETANTIGTDRFDSVYAAGISNSPAVYVVDGQLRQLFSVDQITSNDAWFLKLNKNETILLSEARVSTTTAQNRFMITNQDPTIDTALSTSSVVPDSGNLGTVSASNVIMTYIIVSSCTGFVILCGFIVCFRATRLRVTKELDETKLALTTNLTSAITGETATAVTALMTNHELSIPVFLQMDFGIDFRQETFITKGGGGSLYTCSWLSLELAEMCQHQKLALKLISEGSVDGLPDRIKASFFQVIAIMHKFRDHPLFCKVYAFSVKPVTMVMKCYELGDLDHFVAGKGLAAKHFPYTKKCVTLLTLNMCNAIAFMQQSGLVHCDIKPSNALLEARVVMDRTILIPILIDFGISRIVSREALQVQAFEVSEINGASASFAAPEVWNRLRRREKNVKYPEQVWKAGDLYAFAVTILSLLTRRAPWNQ